MSESVAATGVMFDGRYQLRLVIADGALARVWQARDVRLGREVALKVLAPRADGDPHAAERFAREVQAASALSHPHVITIYDSGATHNSAYLVMELARLGTLAAQIAGGQMPAEYIVKVAQQVCQGLSAAHRAGIIHRDLKPANILRTNEDTVKISDFGAAHLAGSDIELTATGTAVGTAPYMSPEQVRGEPVGPVSDLYSLGCVMYAMAAGKPPFASGTPAGIAWRQLHQEPVPLARRRPDLPPAIDSVVSVLLNKTPVARPASAGIVAQWLSQILLTPHGSDSLLERTQNSTTNRNAEHTTTARMLRVPEAACRTSDAKCHAVSLHEGRDLP
ncbi:hypothetical protein Rhe02_08970 [Rhizocola hellebori]|uniref:non-specific serine/threonine protein kinase n=1 Tax=Rhizocola hellebori TaxID=1392758 RepID=A0A8J3VDL5_9ACTN|nr:serine/threonine-protein kinase [Rhizocola hellebori]GIH02830.1 hypothetical protein Rhe02_08970 [Rhizocola hellebori]